VNWLRRRRTKFNQFLKSHPRREEKMTLQRIRDQLGDMNLQRKGDRQDMIVHHKKEIEKRNLLNEEGNRPGDMIIHEETTRGGMIQETIRCMAIFLGIGNEMRKTRKVDTSVLKIAMPISNLKFGKSI
jgi:hypothetical protein